MESNARRLLSDAKIAVYHLEQFFAHHQPAQRDEAAEVALPAYRALMGLGDLLFAGQENQVVEASALCAAWSAPEVEQQTRQPSIPEAS